MEPEMAKPPPPETAARLKSARAAALAKAMRREPTRAEALLWRELRGLRLHGLHIRRQTPIGNYVADFACHAARLVIEVDGPVHKRIETQARDAARTEWLEGRGYRVIRLAAADIERDAAAAGLTVLAEIERRLKMMC